ncbi:cytochrome c family protein [Novosphingobium sp.]|uniref:cytochrome c family protein n=1 Tax=Novosphingobium sp. TaxID=1874826 RepID=UPI00286E6803|nr:cytochrome c family protein [Novosphingobium sp.]
MEDRFNTIAGWVLFSGIVALGAASLSGHYFSADKPHAPHEGGYPIAGVVEAGEGEAAAVPIETLLASADPAKGEATFKKCASCHTIAAGGANGIGPNLFGVVGKPVGKHAAGFGYSSDLSGHGGNWDWANLNDWLTSPKKFAAGTKMSFAGLSDGQERANLMVYLNSQGSNLPLPTAPAAVAPAEGAAAAPADKK